MSGRRPDSAPQPQLEELAARLEALEGAVEALADSIMRAQQPASADENAARACRELVDGNVPRGERVATTSPETLGPVGQARGIAALPLPDEGAGAVAAVESQRVQGLRFLLLPGPSTEPAGLTEYLRGRYRVVAEQEAGTLLDLQALREPERRTQTLGELLDRLAGGRQAPVLDWTELELAQHLPGRNVFSPLAAPSVVLTMTTVQRARVRDAIRDVAEQELLSLRPCPRCRRRARRPAPRRRCGRRRRQCRDRP